MELYNEYWEQALDILENQLTKLTFDTWIKVLKPVKLVNNTFILKAEYSFARDIIEKKHMENIKKALSFVNGNKDINVKIVTNDELENLVIDDIEQIPASEPVIESKIDLQEPAVQEPKSGKGNNLRLPNGLMPRYTFDNFIVGKDNEMAQAVAVNVSKSLGDIYNPLFLYGDVGLGKTHLMQAIGNAVYQKNPDLNIVYVSCETFTNDLISAIRDNNGTEEFRKKYRKADLLLIDDIQFISGKTSTQEEFFFTFNEIYNKGNQIVITSDRHPNNIQNLTNRLSSRFKSGAIIEINSPNVETRLAILQEKAANQRIAIEDDALRFIAESVNSNIREMEGALTTVIAYAKLINKSEAPISLEVAMLALKDKIGFAKPEITAEYIQSVVAGYYGFTTDDLCSKKKTKDLALARQVAMYLCRKMLNETLVNVGKKFGGKDHSTVMHAVESIGKKMEESSEFSVIMTELERKITT